MSEPRKPIRPETIAEVMLLCRRRCCICYGLLRDLSLKTGQIAHLDGKRNNNDLDNLAFLCFNHHDQYDSVTSQSKSLTPLEVRQFRKELHEKIKDAWKLPLANRKGAREPDDVSGKYIRESEFESAEIDVRKSSNDTINVSGISFWGTKREFGPNIGQLDFTVPLSGNRAEFVDSNTNADDKYRLEIVFEDGRAILKEHYVVGYFGMNVSFQGEYRRIEEKEHANVNYEEILLRILPEIAKLTNSRVDDIGLHVWLCQPGDLVAPGSTISRVARVRLSDATPSRSRLWHKGEGVVGLCWEKQTDVAIDLADQRYQVASEDEWMKLDSDLRVGMSFKDFLDTTRHFRAICASPIVPKFESIGCVSLNFDRDCESEFHILWNKEVKRHLRKAARDIALILKAIMGD